MTDLKSFFHKLKHEIDVSLPESEREAISFLILEHFGYSREEILLGSPLSKALPDVEQIIKRVNQNEPIQYVLGNAWFYGRSFFIRAGVLIPRPETELLIEIILKSNYSVSKLKVLDLGTGSGCIPVTLALEQPKWEISALDINPIALEVSRENAKIHQADIDLRQGSMLRDLPHDLINLDVVVSNPPYIPFSDRVRMQPQVVDFEPHDALFVPDEDPLLFYKAILQIAKTRLKHAGQIYVEIQEGFGPQVIELFQKGGLTQVQKISDLDGKDRVVTAIKP